MSKSPTKVLSIETGYSCNALCGFCPQVTMRKRASPTIKQDLTTEEIRKKILNGAQNGFTQLGFSGGEPTIRKDFIELVAYGKSLGYELIAVTTNGFRLAYKTYAKAITDAGLNSVNISIHGASAKTHNAMMRTPNSFELAIQAVKNIQVLNTQRMHPIKMMSMCLATPQVLKEFPKHIELMGSLGIRLHMIQPLLMNPGNADFMNRMHSDYGEIAKAIRLGSKIAKVHGGHIKLFNTPVCLLWDLDKELERQRNPLSVARNGHVLGPVNVRKMKHNRGYFRIDQCKTCNEPCNGFRVESYPQNRMVEEIQKAIKAHCGNSPDNDLWVGGLDLLKPHPLEEVLQTARAQGDKKIAIITQARSRSYVEQYSNSTTALIDEFIFTLEPPVTKGWLAKKIRHPLKVDGNLEDIRHGLKALKKSSNAPTTSIILLPAHLFREDVLNFVNESAFDTIRIFCHYSQFRVERIISWLIIKQKLLKVVATLEKHGRKVILHSNQPASRSDEREWQGFKNKWVNHPWTFTPHPEVLTMPSWAHFLYPSHAIKMLLGGRKSFWGPTPDAVQPPPKKVFVPHQENNNPANKQTTEKVI